MFSRITLFPSIFVLLIWMLVPLSMTIWFSLQRYNLLYPGNEAFVGISNYIFFLQEPAFLQSLINTFLLVSSVLIITIVGGILLALLLDQPMFGKGMVRVMVISPFFVMPTVSALVWKNMFMNPVNGLFAYFANILSVEPIDFFSHFPLLSIIIIVSWQWLPFATLIIFTSLGSLSREQLEAAKMDGATKIKRFFYIILPHLSRSITIVTLIQTIFLLSIFAEILVTTNGGPGFDSTNLTYLVYIQSLMNFDVGSGSAGA